MCCDHSCYRKRPAAARCRVFTTLVQKLYEDGTGTDVVLLVQGECVPACRNVPMAQSPVFRAMFRHELTEKLTGQTEIQDHSAVAVRKMKRFMYTGTVEDLRDAGAEVLDLAVAHNPPRLKALYAKGLPLLLCEDNVCRIFVTSHAHDLRELKDSAVWFLCSHCEVMTTPCWNECIASNLELIAAFCMAQAELLARAKCVSCLYS